MWTPVQSPRWSLWSKSQSPRHRPAWHLAEPPQFWAPSCAWIPHCYPALCHCSWCWRLDPKCHSLHDPLPFTLQPPVSGLNCAELSKPLLSCSLEHGLELPIPQVPPGHQESSLCIISRPPGWVPQARRGLHEGHGPGITLVFPPPTAAPPFSLTQSTLSARPLLSRISMKIL